MSVAYNYNIPMGGGGGMAGGHPAQQGGGNYPSMYGSFAFKKRFEQIDWKKIASADIDSISRNLDFHTLQDNIMNITFCNIETEVDSRMMDPNFIKLFKLAQLTIEYLLHSQDYLSSMVGTLENKLRKAMEEHEETKKKLNQTQIDFTEMKRECHKRKKMLIAQQQILQAGANAYNKCMYCSKAFVNVSFLHSHITRRHPEYASQYNSMQASQMHYATMPPQQVVPPLENKENKEKDEELERELGEIRERLRLTESQLVDERNARNKMLAEEKEREQEKEEEKKREWERKRREEEKRQKADMEKMQNSVMKEMRELNEKYQAQSELVEALQKKLAGKSGGMDDHERELLRRQREENAMLREQLQNQVQEMEQMNKRRDGDFEAKMKELQKQHKLQIEELSDALEQSVQDLDDRQQEHEVKQEYERKLKEANNMLQNIDEKPTTKEPVKKEQVIHEERQKLQSPAHAPSAMDPPSEDEMTTTMGTATLKTLGGTGSLSLSATRQAQLMDMIRKNPEFLKGMRREVESVFDDKLEKRGVPKNTTGMTTQDFQQKLNLLKQERIQKANGLPNYWDIRQQYLNEVNMLSKQKMDKQKAEEKASGKGPQRNTPLSSSMPLPAARPQVAAAQKSAMPVRAGAGGQGMAGPSRPLGQGIARFKSPVDSGGPKPAPRTPRGGAAGTRNSHDYSQADDTLASGQWSSSEEDDSEDDIDDDDDETTDNYIANGNLSPRRTATTKKVVTTTTTKTSITTKKKAEEESESEDDWDEDISDLGSELEPVTQPKTSTARASPSPRGASVAKLTASIERQLSGRGKKPVGAIDTMNQPDSKKHRQDDLEDEVSLTSISDGDDHPKPQPRQPAVRSSAHSDYSTNTYNTSAWGGSSKGASTVNPQQGNAARMSVNKSLSKQSTSNDVSDGSNWDSDDGGHQDMNISEIS